MRRRLATIADRLLQMLLLGAAAAVLGAVVAAAVLLVALAIAATWMLERLVPRSLREPTRRQPPHPRLPPPDISEDLPPHLQSRYRM